MLLHTHTLNIYLEYISHPDSAPDKRGHHSINLTEEKALTWPPNSQPTSSRSWTADQSQVTVRLPVCVKLQRNVTEANRPVSKSQCHPPLKYEHRLQISRIGEGKCYLQMLVLMLDPVLLLIHLQYATMFCRWPQKNPCERIVLFLL